MLPFCRLAALALFAVAALPASAQTPLDDAPRERPDDRERSLQDPGTAALVTTDPLAREIPYQGVLTNGGAPVTGATAVVFQLYDALTGGALLWTENRTVTPDAAGRFDARLGATTALPDDLGQPLWLAVSVGGTALGPRTALGAAPYALALYGLTVSPSTSSTYPAPNLVGGAPENVVGPSVGGATISGGGSTALPNSVTGSLGTVSGGARNTAAAFLASVGGGFDNEATGEYATVAGGRSNEAASHATVGGGYRNEATSLDATVGGGNSNEATGNQSTVPGGAHNHATGIASFAAGHYAHALHSGAFVWSDRTSTTPFASTNSNQFLVDAAGGVGIGTNAPDADLHVASDSDIVRPHLLLDEAGATDFGRLMFRNANPAGHTWTVAGGGTDAGSLNLYTRGRDVVQFKADAADGGTDPNLIVTSAGGAALTQGGVWTNASSRALKTEFLPVDGVAVLDALADVEVTTWRYHAEREGIRHLGPMSQDFYAAFGLGASDETIGTADADGVALAGVQALYELAQAQAQEISALRNARVRQQAEIDALRADFGALLTRLDASSQVSAVTPAHEGHLASETATRAD